MTGRVVETDAGSVRGIVGPEGEAFLGIPYASAPLGPLRWRPPYAARPWGGVLDADRPGPRAPQPAGAPGLTLGGEEVGHSEDCLTLNVWTPASDSSRRPVLVWIHGGGFFRGSSSAHIYWGGRLAARGDVVVVSLNYRLGALGWLAHPDLTDPDSGIAGNWGLLDQAAALHWVRTNIGGFGGDPDKITVMGQAAGGTAISALMAMPVAQGLFHRAIIQSGRPLTMPLHTAARRAEQVASEAGVRNVGELRDLPVEALLGAQGRAQRQWRIELGVAGMAWQPVVDGVVLPMPILPTVASGDSARIPLLIGTNRDEARSYFVDDERAYALDGPLLHTMLEDYLPPDLARYAVEVYRHAREARGMPAMPSDVWFAIMTDRAFRVAAMRLAEAHVTREPKTFAYLFDWESPALEGRVGAGHGVELPFVFGTLDVDNMPLFVGDSGAAWGLSHSIQDAWLAFARTGDPSSVALGVWPTYHRPSWSTMILGPRCGMIDAPLEAELRFWVENADEAVVARM
jgi:para-nitrobenzyl esterase